MLLREAERGLEGGVKPVTAAAAVWPSISPGDSQAFGRRGTSVSVKASRPSHDAAASASGVPAGGVA